jgi:hypothetical protein
MWEIGDVVLIPCVNITYIVINERRMNSQYIQNNFILLTFLLNIEYQELCQ